MASKEAFDNQEKIIKINFILQHRLMLTLKNSNKKSFGASAPASDLFNHFEINSKKVVEEILALIS